MGENLVLKALGYLQTGGPDRHRRGLHFFGSFYTYGELGKAGVDVVTIPFNKEGAIDYGQMAAAVNDKTKLVAISAVSTANGFEHDLKKVCDIAHAHGAYVYVDMVHAAGSTPHDLRAAGVAFAASSSYKWLMATSPGLQARMVQDRFPRPCGLSPGKGRVHHPRFIPMTTPRRPTPPTATTPRDWPTWHGTTLDFGAVQLDWSLGFIEALTVPGIQAWRQPMMDAVQTELRKRGYEPMTPLGTRTPLVGFALKDARKKLPALLDKANVKMTVSQNRFRASVSVFNDMNDVDRLLAALPKTPPA